MSSITMPHYQAVFNGAQNVMRKVQKKKEIYGGVVEPTIQINAAVTKPKVEDKKALRLKMAALLMKTL
jgi:hypothetical protein